MHFGLLAYIRTKSRKQHWEKHEYRRIRISGCDILPANGFIIMGSAVNGLDRQRRLRFSWIRIETRAPGKLLLDPSVKRPL